MSDEVVLYINCTFTDSPISKKVDIQGAKSNIEGADAAIKGAESQIEGATVKPAKPKKK